MGKSLMGPGFRFKPTDVELLQYYLKRKIMGRKLHSKVIAELDIYKYEPWDLPDKSSSDSGDLKWYFFCPREKKYNNGNRIKRGTGAGYWKATGNDRSVVYCGQVSGWIKTLVFHTGKPPRGDRTDWVMHEYRLENQALADKGVALDSYVICMFFQKEGPGPRNGAQYGVPFKEEDWSDDEVEISSEAVQESNIPESDLRHLCNHNNPVATIMHSPEDIGTYASSASCIFDILPFSSMAPQLVSSNYLIQKKPHASDATNDISSMEKNTFFTKEKENAGMRGPYLIPPTDSAIGTHLSEGIGTSPFESSTSVIVPPPCNFLQPDAARYVTAERPHVSYGDDILSMFDCFIEKSAFCMHEVDNNEVDGWLDSFPNRNMPEPDPVLVNNDDNSIAACGHSPMVIGLGPSFEAWRFDVLPPSCNVPQLGSCSYVTMEKPRASNGDDILPMMDCFSEESTFVMNELDKTEEPNDGFHFGNANATHHFDTSNVGGVLADSGNFTIVGEVGNVFSSGPDDYMRDFLELGDLDQPQHPSHFF